MSNITITEKIILNEVAEVLDDLTDVNAAAPLNGQSLVWNGTAWVPQTVSGGGASVYTFDPEDPYGATGDGTTNDATAFTNMFADIATAGGGKVQLQDKSYSINSQISLTSWSNTTIDGNAIGELTKSAANTLRIITAGTQGAPHSSTTPQVENVHFQNLTVQGLGTIAGNNASLINNSGNIFQLLSCFNVSFDNCRFKDVDNGAIRLPATSEGDLFYNLSLTPTVVSTTEFSVPGNQTAVFIPGSAEDNFFGVFNGAVTSIGNLRACGYVSSATFDGTKTNVVLTLTKGTITAPITAVGKVRTLTSFKGYVNIHDSYFENVKQIMTTNTNGTDHVKIRNCYIKNSGAIKPTSQVYGNSYHVYEGNVLDNCAERIFLQGTNEAFVRNNIFFNGTGTGGNNYAAVLIAPNTEQIVYEDKKVYVIEGNHCKGDYQTIALEGNNVQLYDTLIIRNNIFEGITAGKLGSIVPLLSRFKRVIIENNEFRDIGSGVDIIELYPYAFSTDSHVEQVIIRNNRGNGGRYWLNIDGAAGGNTRYATDIQVYANDFRGHKGHFLRNIDRMVWRHNYLEYAASDGTSNQFYFQNIINSRFEDNTISVAAGSTVAGTLFNVLTSASGTVFKRNEITIGDGAFVAQANGTVARTSATQFTITDLRVQSGTIASTGAAQFTITETGTSYVSRYASGTYFEATAAGVTIATGTVSGTPTYGANVTTVNVTVSTGALAGMDGVKYGVNHTANYDNGRPVQATQTGTVIGRAIVTSSSYAAAVTTVNVTSVSGTLTSMDGVNYQIILSALTNSTGSINFVVEDNDITATNDALSLSGTNLTGSVKRNILRGGGVGGYYDIVIGSGVGALQVEDNRYITGNVSIDYTGVRNVKSTTWNPPSIAAGGNSSTTVTVPDAITTPVRDEIIVIPSVSLGGLLLDTNISTPGAFTNISGGVVAYASATTFTVTDAGVDHTAEFPQRRYVRFLVGGAYLGYGYVTASSYDGVSITTVTVNVVEGTMPNTLDDVDYWTNGVVTLTLYNNTAGAIDLASSTWYVQARRRI